jgi:hypothetical protein
VHEAKDKDLTVQHYPLVEDAESFVHDKDTNPH